MLAPQLLRYLESEIPQIAFTSDERQSVEHFGSPASELEALVSSAAICPLPEFVRIQATGQDRQKFLHNFCTNSINELPAGNACEAFFTDVKAKVLAHGYILAGADVHEVWMLPGDRDALLNHLNRYIITEDVTIEAIPGDCQTFAVMGPETSHVLQAFRDFDRNVPAAGKWASFEGGAVLLMEWNQAPIAFVTVSAERALDVWQNLVTNGATASGTAVFHHQRILEGFPVVGVDIDKGNLAPEADRSNTAISYTKGCYLGQEPIARIDAMGHVNRKVYRATIESAASEAGASDTQNELPLITSRSTATDENPPVLVTLNVNSAEKSEDIPARTADGNVVTLKKT